MNAIIESPTIGAVCADYSKTINCWLVSNTIGDPPDFHLPG